MLRLAAPKLTWKGTSERVTTPCAASAGAAAAAFGESGCLGMQPKVGGKLHLKLNNGTRPIANKYREGETPVEARSNTDVQIVCQTWV